MPGATKAQLTLEEVVRIAITTVSAAGGLFGVLQMMEWKRGPIFPAPIDAGFACALLALVLETCRRLDHGESARRRGTRPGLRS